MILDVFPSYKDKDMVDLLYRYERETCLSLNILVEKYLEELLYKNGYLNAEIEEENSLDEEVETLVEETESLTEIEDSKYIRFHKGQGKFTVQKWIKNITYSYGSFEYFEEAKKVRNFLISKNWDIKYSTRESGLKGKKYLEWIFSEIEKEANND